MANVNASDRGGGTLSDCRWAAVMRLTDRHQMDVSALKERIHSPNVTEALTNRGYSHQKTTDQSGATHISKIQSPTLTSVVRIPTSKNKLGEFFLPLVLAVVLPLLVVGDLRGVRSVVFKLPKLLDFLNTM